MRTLTLFAALALPVFSFADSQDQDPYLPCRAEVIEISHNCGGIEPDLHSCVEVEYALDTKDSAYVCLHSSIAGHLGCLAMADYDAGVYRFELGHLSDSEREADFEVRCLFVEEMQLIE